MKASEWIDRLKEARGWVSDYRVTKELGISHPTLSRYRNKPESTMDDDTAVKVAAALEVEPEIIIIDQVTERTRSEPARAALSGLLDRIAGKARAGGGGGGTVRVDITSVAAAVAIGAAALLGAPPAEAQVPSTAPEYASYKTDRRRRKAAMSPLQRLARALFPASPTGFAALA